jgi:hypothetical protein
MVQRMKQVSRHEGIQLPGRLHHFVIEQIEEVDDEVVRDMRGTHTHQSYPVYTLPRFGSRGLP